ncbi:LuxR C-terminal-related transcriptional regulator [Bradyrhizobium xenonodulans]|uniref:LuxR C-terminal-related transcriptional regulator n=1 Tax=Bradyrhizobium xenonodulans TaxID=2736875 RepID=A0ABY7MT37_9BRAD|nr:LuxR C-terminal-related transcriptional regulator [Bradyrhizobium xenonodulans]WBL80110.1 LuxR C-terminal-related transcriptional regulator [Bradyrhizobium xenonodulans]
MLDVTAKQEISARIRLVIGDRQPVVLQGLTSILAAQHDFDLVASSRDGASCLEAIRNLTPDVALLADTLPDLTATEILAIAKAESLPTRLVFFTQFESNPDLAAAIAAGACSAISKYASPDTMLRSLRLTTKRGVFPEQSYLWPTGKHADGGVKIEKMLELLTHRERQIARLVSVGMSNKEIARQLNVSPGTVKVHLFNIFQKLGITNRTVLAARALLQRPSGFGTLALAFLAIAIADELKASEASDTLPNDDSVGHAGEYAEYEPWKKAILRHLIVWESAETPPLTQRDVFAKLSQLTSPAAAMEALRAAEQSAGSKSWKDHGPVGSSTPNLPAPLLRGTIDTQMSGEPTADHLFPRLTSNPMSLHGGYGTFATLAGALIYALHDPHLALQPHERGHASIDSFVVAGENATIKVAATHADANHANNSVPSFLSHDFHLPSAVGTTGNDNVALEGGRGQMGPSAAGDDLQKPLGVLDSGDDAGVGGYSRDQQMGGNVENVVYRSPIDSKSTSSDSVFDFASGPSRINLAAFGGLAWLHMTAASKSIPPHTLAWIYNSASNETIVYVNPTDHVLDVGDRGLLEIHLRGIVAIAEADVVSQPDGAAITTTLEQLEAALISATATDETVLSTANGHPSIGASESTLGTAGVWAGDGLGFQFGQTRAGLGGTTRFRTSGSESTDAPKESDGASAVSAHISSIGLAPSATIPAVENLTSKSEPVNAGTGALSTKQDEIVQPSVAMADSADRGNSQHASEPESANGAPESAQAKSIPGNGVGNDDEHHSEASDDSPGSAKTAEPSGVEHSNSGHSPSVKDVADSVAAAGSADRGNSQHASEPESANGAPESAQPKAIPGNGVGNDDDHHSEASHGSPGSAKTAEPSGVEHSNSEHSTSAKEAADSVAAAGSADRGNSQHASEPGSEEDPPEGAQAKAMPGNGVGKDDEHHSQASDDSPGSAKTAEPSGVEHSNSEHSTSAKEAADSVAAAGSADRGNSQHASEPGSEEDPPEGAQAKAMPGNGVGKDDEHHSQASDGSPGSVKTAEPSGVEHSNSEHSTSAKEAAESAAMAGSADHGNSQHASEPGSAAQSATIALEAAQPAKAASETAAADQELVFRFDSEATPSTLVAIIEPKELNNSLDPHVPPGLGADLDIIVKTFPNTPDEHAVHHGNNGTHLAIGPASHDLLI